jgi:uncharacterized membrane-anchored protein YitT (DUF2179 family)
MLSKTSSALYPRKEQLIDILFDVLGCAVYAVGVQIFSSPNNIAPGGVTGTSILVEYLTGFPLSLMTLLLNIPLLLMAWFLLGKRFTLRTMVTVGILSGMLELTSFIHFAYRGEMILAALFGGVLEGVGLGLVFMRGSTTGGTDVASRLIQLGFPQLSVGRLMLAVDACVLAASAIVYRNIENALYGLVAIFTATSIIDKLLYGLDAGRVLLIISQMEREIATAISEQLERGCTFLEGRGSYTGADRPVLLCVVRRNQFHRVKRLTYAIDPTAFVMTMEATEVIGEGFKPPQGEGDG